MRILHKLWVISKCNGFFLCLKIFFSHHFISRQSCFQHTSNVNDFLSRICTLVCNSATNRCSMLYGPQPLWNDPSEIYPAINQSRQTARREYERKPGIIRIIKSIQDLSHTTNALLCLANTHFICRYDGKRHQGWEPV